MSVAGEFVFQLTDCKKESVLLLISFCPVVVVVAAEIQFGQVGV